MLIFRRRFTVNYISGRSSMQLSVYRPAASGVEAYVQRG